MIHLKIKRTIFFVSEIETMDLWMEARYLLERNEELYFHFRGRRAAIIHYLNRAALIFGDGYTLGVKYYREGISKGNENSKYNEVLYPA